MNALLAVFVYEWRRTLTAGRIAWWFVLAAFPVGLTLLIRWQPDFGRNMTPEQIATVWSTIYYMLIPCVCCALGVFLNAAPAISAELEQRSWTYLATRPWGVMRLMLGKYFVAVVWAVTSAIASISFATVISVMDFHKFRSAPSWLIAFGSLLDSSWQALVHSEQSSLILRTWVTIIQLSVLSSFAYAALFLMIGAMFPRRAMVFCVAYTALVEVVLSLIPAVINRITIQYRMRSLMMNWADPVGRDQIQDNIFFRYVFAEGSNAEQILWLCGLTLLFLIVALSVAQHKEFTSAYESDL